MIRTVALLIAALLALVPAAAAPQAPSSSAPPAPAVGVQLVASGFEQPLLVTAPPGDPRLFVVDQPGRIFIVNDGKRLEMPFLDIRSKVAFGGERGLLGLAFHPDYKRNGRFFVDYTDKAATRRSLPSRCRPTPTALTPRPRRPCSASSSRPPTITAAGSPSGPTAISTSAWATAVAAATPIRT